MKTEGCLGPDEQHMLKALAKSVVSRQMSETGNLTFEKMKINKSIYP